MIRRLLMALTALLGLASTTLLAHEGDKDLIKLPPINPRLTSEQVGEMSTKQLAKLVESKKVAAAWVDVHFQSIGAYGKDRDVTWMVSYKNPDGKLDNGKPLFLIFDDRSGNFVSFNNTGDLPPKKKKKAK